MCELLLSLYNIIEIERRPYVSSFAYAIMIIYIYIHTHTISYIELIKLNLYYWFLLSSLYLIADFIR